MGHATHDQQFLNDEKMYHITFQLCSSTYWNESHTQCQITDPLATPHLQSLSLDRVGKHAETLGLSQGLVLSLPLVATSKASLLHIAQLPRPKMALSHKYTFISAFLTSNLLACRLGH